MGMGKFFKVSTDHHFAAEEMHKRVANACDNNSIVWHICLWPEEEIRASETVAEQNSRKNEWIKSINNKLSRMVQIVDPNSSHANFQFKTFEDGRKSTKKSLSFWVKTDGFTWRIKAESHFEFVTITNTISFHEVSKNDALAENIVWPEKQVGFSLQELTALMKSLSLCDRTYQKDSKELCNTIFSKFWVSYAREICKVKGKRDSFEKFPGLMIADFRGLVLPAFKNKNIAKIESLPEKANAIVSSYNKLISSAQLSDKSMEFVVCSMLDYRTVYASTLGSYLNDASSALPNNEKDFTSPVLYCILLSEDLNKKQIGRLIERINALGVSRIAALKGLEVMRIVGREIQAMGLRLNNIISSDKTQDCKQIQIDQFLIELNSLTAGNAGSSNTIVEGVTYRIARSDYYASLIETRLRDLRIERIEGWQPYDEFLRRRLFPTFKFIQDIGDRIRILRRRVDSVQMSIEVRQSKELLSSVKQFQEGIKKQEEIQTQLLEEQQESSNKQDSLNTKVFILTVFTVLFGLIAVAADLKDLNLY